MAVYRGMLVVALGPGSTRGWRNLQDVDFTKVITRARAMEKPQVKWAIADAQKDFIAKFGREPLEGEPLIVDPDFDTPIRENPVVGRVQQRGLRIRRNLLTGAVVKCGSHTSAAWRQAWP
jgi:hypothetical protein